MAETYEIRQVAIEIQKNIAALKVTVDALQTAANAINTVAAAWTVNSDDASLPAELEVKAQLQAYEALSVALSKPALTLNDSISNVRAAE